jgi:hypothetical protein
LIDVAANRGARGIFHRFGHRKIRKALREVHRLMQAGDARHLSDDGFGERRGSSGCEHSIYPRILLNALRMSSAAPPP